LLAFFPARYLFSALSASRRLPWRKSMRSLYLAQALYSAGTLYLAQPLNPALPLNLAQSLNLAQPPKPKSLWLLNPVRTFNPSWPLKLVPKP
jgi:hypothetical protein